MFQPRSRLINFRVTEDEFKHLKAVCDAQGFRGLSDFARRSILECARNPRRLSLELGSASAILAGLEQRLFALESRVEELTKSVTGAPSLSKTAGQSDEMPANGSARVTDT